MTGRSCRAFRVLGVGMQKGRGVDRDGVGPVARSKRPAATGWLRPHLDVDGTTGAISAARLGARFC